MIRKIGTTIRVTPDVVRLDVPIHHAQDLPQIARRLREAAFALDAAFQNPQLNENAMLSDAYAVLRNLNRQLKKEFPK